MLNGTLIEGEQRRQATDAIGSVLNDGLVMLMNLRLPPRCHIVEHDDKIHGPGWPNRFRVVIEGFATQKPSEQP